MKRALVFPVLFAAAVPLSSCGNARAERSDPPAIVVPVVAARVEQLAAFYHASGTVHGRNSAILSSRTPGYVRKVLVKAGDHVVAGQLLVTLEANNLEAHTRSAGTGIDQATDARLEAQNGLASAEALARNAKINRDRAASLLEAHAVTQAAFDDADAQWRAAAAQEQMARARVRAAEDRIAQAKADLAEARANLNYAQIVAPFAGRIVERRVDPGNLASPGMPLVVLEQDDRFRIEVPVEESRAAGLQLGDDATVELNAGDPPVHAAIDEIVPNVDVSSRASLVKLALPAELKGLRPGMFARVTFRIGQRRTLVVPTEAVTTLGALERVFVVDGNHAHLRMITIGESNGPWTEVLSGLSPDEPVVAAPTPDLRDGAQIVARTP